MFCLLTSVSLSQSAPADHDGERQQHREPDREFVRRVSLPGASAPSMNWRTTGSAVAWSSATVPTCRMRALVQHGDPVADGEGAPHVVGDDEPGHAEIAGTHHELIHHRGR